MKKSAWVSIFASVTGLASLPSSLAAADPLADPASIWTFQDENASITTSKLTDKYYVNGLRIAWTSPTDTVPLFLANFARAIWAESGTQRWSIGLAQSIFTPANTTIVPPNPTDRPYAGVLTANLSVLQDTDRTRSVLGLEAGIVGPAAGAEQVQNDFHDLIGYGHTLGWGYQIRDAPVAELLAQRDWRFALSNGGGLETDAVPMLEGGAGNLRVYGLAGSLMRIGQGLDSDFGPARIRPGLTGSDAYTNTRPIAWYFFAGLDGQAVGYDISIDGTKPESSDGATRAPFIGEAEAGFAIMILKFRISYTQVFQTEETRHQEGGIHEFGALTLSGHF